MSHARDNFLNRMFSVLLLGTGLTVSAGAQTAHFSYAQVTVGGGFTNPAGVAVDGIGDVFVADAQNNAVKEILPGCVTSGCVASLGRGFNHPQGVAVDATGNVFVADTYNNLVKEIVAASGYTEVLTLGIGFHSPTGVAVDSSGNVFVADSGNNAVKEMLASEYYIIPHILGSGFHYPDGVALDSSGNVFVADQGNNAVKEILAASGYTTVNTVASGINTPLCIAVDRNGNVFVAADGEIGVDEILAASSYTTIFKLGIGFNKSLGVAVDGSGNVFVADLDNSRVLKLQTAPVDFLTVAIDQRSAAIPLTFTMDSGGSIGRPMALTLGAEGLDFADAGTGTCTSYGPSHVYAAGDSCTVNVTFAPRFAGQRNGAVRLRDNSGNTIAMTYVHGAGSGPQVNFPPGSKSTVGGGFGFPFGVAVDGAGNVFVADFGFAGSAVKEVPPGCDNWRCVKTLGGSFNAPDGIAVDGNGNVFVADAGDNTVKELLAASGYVTMKTLGSGFNNPMSVAVDDSGNVFVADCSNNAVKEILAASGYLTVNTLGSGFIQPSGVAVDVSGNVFVVDGVNNDPNSNTVKELPAADGYRTVITLSSSLTDASGIALDGNGNLFVTEFYDEGVKELRAADGYATVYAVTNALRDTANVAVDGGGNLYITSPYSGPPLKLDLADAPSLSFATQTMVGTTDATDGQQAVLVQNVGNAPLTFQPFVAGSLLDAVLGTQSAASCMQLSNLQLQAGDSCTVGIEFEPTQAGLVHGYVNLVDSALNAPPPAYKTQTISLRGTGVAAQQTISFSPPASPITYGVSPIRLYARGGNSGNPVTFKVTNGRGRVSGNELTIYGAGSVIIQATQAGNNKYAPATPVSVTITVKRAPLTVTATNAARLYGAANPNFTYTIAGYVNGDKSTVVSGSVSETTTAVAASAAGTYPIRFSNELLKAANYSFVYVNGTLTVVATPPTI